jgi:hypothetical protein
MLQGLWQNVERLVQLTGVTVRRRNDMAVRKTEAGANLQRWFKEKWVDVRTGKPCGRQKGESRAYPYCRPSKRVSSKTPKTASELTAAEKRSRLASKKSSKKVKRVT